MLQSLEKKEALHNCTITEGLQGDIPANFDGNSIDSGVIDSPFVMNLVAYLEQQHY